MLNQAVRHRLGTFGFRNCRRELTASSHRESFSHLMRSQHVRRKPIVLSMVFFRPFHENDGCSFCDIFQSSQPNRFGSVCTVYTTLDRPYRQKTLHKHVRMYICPRNAAVAKICFNYLMPGENRSVGVMISRECAQVHDMMYTVTLCRIDQ